MDGDFDMDDATAPNSFLWPNSPTTGTGYVETESVVWQASQPTCPALASLMTEAEQGPRRSPRNLKSRTWGNAPDFQSSSVLGSAIFSSTSGSVSTSTSISGTSAATAPRPHSRRRSSASFSSTSSALASTPIPSFTPDPTDFLGLLKGVSLQIEATTNANIKKQRAQMESEDGKVKKTKTTLDKGKARERGPQRDPGVPKASKRVGIIDRTNGSKRNYSGTRDKGKGVERPTSFLSPLSSKAESEMINEASFMDLDRDTDAMDVSFSHNHPSRSTPSSTSAYVPDVSMSMQPMGPPPAASTSASISVPRPASTVSPRTRSESRMGPPPLPVSAQIQKKGPQSSSNSIVAASASGSGSTSCPGYAASTSSTSAVTRSRPPGASEASSSTAIVTESVSTSGPKITVAVSAQTPAPPRSTSNSTSTSKDVQLPSPLSAPRPSQLSKHPPLLGMRRALSSHSSASSSGSSLASSQGLAIPTKQKGFKTPFAKPRLVNAVVEERPAPTSSNVRCNAEPVRPPTFRRQEGPELPTPDTTPSPVANQPIPHAPRPPSPVFVAVPSLPPPLAQPPPEIQSDITIPADTSHQRSSSPPTEADSSYGDLTLDCDALEEVMREFD